MKRFPSFRFQFDLSSIESRAEVIPIGMNLESLDSKSDPEIPVFVWNHRWEHDKNPETFFLTLFELKRLGIRFQLIVMGKSFDSNPDIFQKAREVLKEEIIHFGYAEREKYHELLLRANILLVTSNQDFFGISVVEAIHFGCYPVIPNRLAYSEHINPDLLKDVVYDSDGQIINLLLSIIGNKKYREVKKFQSFVYKYDWHEIIKKYDGLFQQMRQLTNGPGY